MKVIRQTPEKIVFPTHSYSPLKVTPSSNFYVAVGAELVVLDEDINKPT